jgi:PAS domain-containing protein
MSKKEHEDKEGEHLQQIIRGVYDQFREILDQSDQSVYIYLDDIHKVCNEKFAALLGYSSAKEWADVSENFPDVFLQKDSQSTLVGAFRNAMEKFVGSQNVVNWKTKDGKTVKTTTILVPIIFEHHGMALHYISPTK